MRGLFTLLFPLLMAVGSYGQINGRVTDVSGQAVPFCNVLLARSSDTVMVTGSTTDTSGNFQLEIKDTGSFILVSSFIGYKKYYSKPFFISKGTAQYSAGTLELQADAQVLKSVQVTAEKPFMEYKVDRTVFNIETSVIAAGNDGLEVLKKLPGVTVDNNDQISVRGKPGVLIMIDGKTSYLSAADAANYLRSFNASQIEKIEVITNPSAKYDASGMAVINIILKKDKNLGLNARLNISHAQGFYGTTSGGFNANYRTRKFNFFGSYNNYHVENYVQQNRGNVFSSSGGEPLNTYHDGLHRIIGGYGGNGRIGVDFTADRRQTIGAVIEGNLNRRTDAKNDIMNMYNSSSVLDSGLYMHGTRYLYFGGINYGLNYLFKIDSLGRELSANIDYSAFSPHMDENDETDYYNAFNQYLHAPALQRYKLLGDLTIKAAKLDYVQPIGEKKKLEAGLKSSVVNSDNDSRYWNVIGQAEIPDASRTNHFIYFENIKAGYANFSDKLSERLETQIGLRAEQTVSKGTQRVNDSSFTRNYLNFFPSLFVGWKADSDNAVNFSYSRRVERPGYGQMNPFLFFTNPYSYEKGNPFLQPQLSHNFELAHVFKGFLSTTLTYINMTRLIADAIHQNDSTRIVYRTPENLSTWNCYAITVSSTLHPLKWWTSVTSATVFHDHYFGAIQEGFYSNSHFTGEFNALNTFTFKKDWSAEISGYWRTLNLYGTTIDSPIYRVGAGVKKRFADGKGTFSVSCPDVFWTDRFTERILFQGLNYINTTYRDTRRIILSLSWKFGQSQYRREEKSKGAADEINRVNQGQ